MSIQNLSDYSPDSLYSLCSLDGVKRNQSSAYYVVTLSTSVIIAFLSPVAVAGNSLVLAAIWRDQSLRTPSYILLFGLALTDLCTGLISQPSHIAVRVLCFNELQLVKKEETFLLYTKALGESCGTYFGSLTVILITFMSIERWLHMTRRSLLTVRRSCYIVAVSSLLLITVVVFRLLHVFQKTTGPCTKSLVKPGFYPGPSLVKKPGYPGSQNRLTRLKPYVQKSLVTLVTLVI